MNYPTKEDLNKLWWYRLFNVFQIVVIVSTFCVTFYKVGLLDALMNALIWYIVFLIFWQIIQYIVFGKKPKTESPSSKFVINANKNEIIDIFMTILTMIGVVVLIALFGYFIAGK